MSRIGNKPISIPSGVTVDIKDDAIEVKGPKGTLSSPLPQGVTCKMEGEELIVERAGNEHRAMHGLTRALAGNAITGVTEGFNKQMDVVGVGYKVEIQGKKLVFALGYSHPVEYVLPDSIDVTSERLPEKSDIQQYQTTLTLSGMDKQLLGQVCAELNRLRKPDAYKGKGIRYADRYYRLKQGKTAV